MTAPITAPLPVRRLLAGARGRTIALMGGSFNPAHPGHLEIARLALKRLHVAEVWWLVSPGNPLKTAAGMAPFAARMASAVHMAAGERRIRVTDIEALLHTRYTADTLHMLAREAPSTRFIWVMGADSLVEFHRWRDWRQIFKLVVIAIFDRPSYSLKALSGRAARRFSRMRLPERSGRRLGGQRAPAWIFFHTRLNALSATALRKGREHGARARSLQPDR